MEITAILRMFKLTTRPCMPGTCQLSRRLGSCSAVSKTHETSLLALSKTFCSHSKLSPPSFAMNVYETELEIVNDVNTKCLQDREVLSSLDVNKNVVGKRLSHLENDSHVKDELVKKLTLNRTDIASFKTLPVTTLNLIVKRFAEDKKLIKNFPNRIAYLCHYLNLEKNDLISLCAKHTSLLTMKFSRLDAKVQIFKNGNINVEYIVKDLWIFNYNEKLLAERVSAARKAGFPLKPWLLRCPKKYFTTVLSKWEETQHILKGLDQVAYLAKRLDCTEDYVKYIMEKNSILPSINVVKLKKIFDFLYDNGYTPEELRLFPKVFCCSIETLNKRFDTFYSIRGVAPTIPQLSISNVMASSLKCESKLDTLK